MLSEGITPKLLITGACLGLSKLPETHVSPREIVCGDRANGRDLGRDLAVNGGDLNIQGDSGEEGARGQADYEYQMVSMGEAHASGE